MIITSYLDNKLNSSIFKQFLLKEISCLMENLFGIWKKKKKKKELALPSLKFISNPEFRFTNEIYSGNH